GSAMPGTADSPTPAPAIVAAMAAASGACSARIGVRITPGGIELTRMLSRPSSSAAVLVSPRTAHLLDTYAASPNVAVNPAPEEILTIAPPPALRIEGSTARIPRY